MYIIHVASEFSPIAKVGGLADVLQGLSIQQEKNGHNVEVIIPKYDIINLKELDSLEIYTQDLWSYEDNQEIHNTVYIAKFKNIILYLIDAHHNQYYFNKGIIYGAFNDTERFLYFCRTATEFLHKEKKFPHILHLHDWTSAAIAPLIRSMYQNLNKNIGSIIFNIHNIEHQGKIHPKYLSKIGLRGEDFLTKDKMQDHENPSIINLMKGAINYCDSVVTVSPTYANEIKTTEYGYGLSSTITKNNQKLFGILNGIETDFWNPSTDLHIPETFSSNSTYIKDIIKKKDQNKKDLYKKLNMTPSCSGPLIISVTRLATQKSPDLILRALHRTTQLGGSFILLGAHCDNKIEKKFSHIKESLINNPSVYISSEFDESLARQLFASADAIFIPSKFEPCGLTQMISMRYGTIPIVRNTGGLKDTITDISKDNATGFVFDELTEKSVDNVLDDAFNIYHNDKLKWYQLIQNGMNKDYSWKKPAKLYDEVYAKSSRNKPDLKNVM